MSQEQAEQTQELACIAPAGVWVVEITSPSENQIARLEPGGRLILGSGRGVGVEIPDRAVSQRHAELIWTPTGVRVRDCGSKNGVMLGSARVAEAHLVASGSHFQLGHTLVVLRAEETGEPPLSCPSIPGVVGSSAAMRRVARDVHRAAPLKAPVLILGESGTGKDLIASALHRLSKRDGMFVPLNMGAVSESLADAELFGHTKGAFTGAVADRVGAFELAHGGTLFLDEIADLSPALQVKLLRVVEDGRVRALGSGGYRDVEVRIVSATWADLSERASQRRFREDLLHRISTLVIRLPPLRQRKSDIATISAALLRRFESELGPMTLSDSGLRALMDYDWPGNVRELASVLYRAALNAQAGVVDAVDVEQSKVVRRERAKPILTPSEALQTLKEHNGNASAAARALRVPRSTFRSWIERAGESAA